MNTRTHRTVWTYLSGLAYTVVGLFTGLIATPLLLRWLGDERLGAYRASLDWAGYLLLLDFGLSGALLPMFARAVAKDDSKSIRAVFWIGVRAYVKVSLSIVICGCVLGYFLPSLVHVSPELVRDVRRGFWIGQLGALVLPLAPFWCLALSSQRGYVSNALLAFQTLTATALFLYLAHLGWGITGQFVAMVIASFFFHILIAIDGLRRYRLFSPRPSADELSENRRELRKLNMPTLIVNVCTRVGLLTDNIVIAFFLGSPMVVPFFITQRLATLAQSQIQSVGSASWAGMAELHVTGQRATFSRLTCELSTLVMIIGLASLVPIVAYNHQFIARWVGGARFAGEVVSALAAINVLLIALLSTWSTMLAGTGHMPRLVRLNIVSATINIAVSVVATWKWGLVGPLIGTLAAVSTTSIWWLPLLLREVYEISVRELFRAVAVPLAWAAPYAAVLGWWSHTHTARGWMMLCTEMALAAIFFLLLAWFLIFDEGQRRSWMGRVRLILRRRSAAALPVTTNGTAAST